MSCISLSLTFQAYCEVGGGEKKYVEIQQLSKGGPRKTCADKLIDTESRMVVAKGWWVGENGELLVKGYKLPVLK